MEPTDNSLIRQTEWFTNPVNPLMQYKIYSARIDNLIYYVTAERGITRMGLNYLAARSKPMAVQVEEFSDIPDNSADQLKKLKEFLSKPAA